MANGEFGYLNPPVIIQEDTRACFSACLRIATDPANNISESAISQLLIRDDLYLAGVGTRIFPARELDPTLNEIGLSAKPLYDARIRGHDERTQVLGRLARIDAALRRDDVDSVILAYPKRRVGQEPFPHFSVATGFRESKKGDGVVIVDPSDVDGDVKHPSWRELLEYATPANTEQEKIPVMAWAIERIDNPQTRTFNFKVGGEGLPGFSLLAQPLYRPEDVGEPIPTTSDHACSVAMTSTDSTLQFADGGGVTLSRGGEHPYGYPRFVVPPSVKELSQSVNGNFSGLPFPTSRAAEAAIWPERTYPPLHNKREAADTEVVEKDGLYWLRGTELNVQAWQHTGLGISSRQAAANLTGREENNLKRRANAEKKIKAAITEQTGAMPEDIYLFPTGMAATYWLNQALIKSSGGLPSAQFGFPYTDTFEQGWYGPHKRPKSNVKDLRTADYAELEAMAQDEQPLRSVFTEIPSNPLLWTPDLERLERSLDGATPIVVDDTIGTMFNIDDEKLPPAVVARMTSLTKFFSSVGDVMGGSVVLRPDSPHYENVKAALDELYEDTIWYEDAEILAKHSKLFPEFMPVINSNAQKLAEWLLEEKTGKGKPLKDVYYPSTQNKREYASVMKDSGGFGGLMSLRFNSPKQAYRYFDALRVTKGPSLGTFYTLGCLYTWLAHKPVDSVKKFGVVPDLVRLSVGIEDEAELQSRMSDAFEASL